MNASASAQGLIVENYNTLSNKTLSPIKHSLQLNALEMYGIVVQHRRFIRAGTLTSYRVWRWIAFQKKSDSLQNRPMELLVICELYLKQRLLLDQKDNVNIHCSHP